MGCCDRQNNKKSVCRFFSPQLPNKDISPIANFLSSIQNIMPHKSLTKPAIDKTVTDYSSQSDRARYFCRLARLFEDAGEYEAAVEALREFWFRDDRASVVEGLEPSAGAEVLLRVGVLSGWTGAADQTPDAQERAKDFISQSIEIFERLEATDKVAEARSDLAYCYWREGAFDEARLMLTEVISGKANQEIKAIASLRLALVEKTAGRYNDYAVALPRTGTSQRRGIRPSFG